MEVNETNQLRTIAPVADGNDQKSTTRKESVSSLLPGSRMVPQLPVPLQKVRSSRLTVAKDRKQLHFVHSDQVISHEIINYIFDRLLNDAFLLYHQVSGVNSQRRERVYM